MASSSKGGAPDTATLRNALYERCLQTPNQLFYQDDLLDMGIIPKRNVELLLVCVNELMKENLFKLQIERDGVHSWKISKREDAAKYKTLTNDEAMVYSYIEAAGNAGIWTRNLKMRSNLHISVLNRCLKSLENRSLVKTINSVKYPTRKIYMLAHLTPSEDNTGGPWFTDGELDTDFVEEIARVAEHWVWSRSWVERKNMQVHVSGPKKGMTKAQAEELRAKELESKRARNAGPTLLPFPPGYKKYPTVPEITRFINQSQVTPEPLNESEIRQLMDVLCYDGRVEKVMGGTAYKAVKRADGEDLRPGNGLTEVPCGRCPVFDLCEEGGPVNASNCEYFRDWLDI